MHVLLLRHCRALGQEPHADLTEAGFEQAVRLIRLHHDIGIHAIVASPWARAMRSVRPLAETAGVVVSADERLTEYVLAPRPREDWREQLRRNFAEPSRVLDGGESVSAAAARLAAVLGELDPAVNTVVATHGGLIAAWAHVTGAVPDGYTFWQRLGTPAVLAVHGDALEEIEV